MQNAQTLAELDGLAQIVRGYDIPKETTESLRTTYTTRREELSNVEAQSIDSQINPCNVHAPRLTD